MKAGTLRDRITIQRKTGHVDTDGQPMDAWEEVAKVWAHVRHQSGSEAIKANAETSTVRASIRIRWRTGIHAGMRVLHAGQVYDIQAVLPGATREHVDLVAVQGANNG